MEEAPARVGKYNKPAAGIVPGGKQVSVTFHLDFGIYTNFRTRIHTTPTIHTRFVPGFEKPLGVNSRRVTMDFHRPATSSRKFALLA